MECGGGEQTRTRTCDDPPPQGHGADCPGRNFETRSCNEFPCPDCARGCPVGCSQRDGVCGICDKAGNSINGSVSLCGTAMPMADVEVYSIYNLLVPLAVTGVDGMFVLNDLCEATQELLFYKDGFTSEQETYIHTGQHLQVSMCKNHIVFVEHPQHTAVFSGADITLSCLATGVPDITHYDWFADFAVISHGDEVAGDSSVFTISGATEADSGTYQCRAVSPLLKKFSRAAQVIVKGSGEDTCSGDLESDMVHLKGCTASMEGSTVSEFDRGSCAGPACSIRGEDSTGMCCEMKTSEMISVTCATYTYDTSRILSCGCAPCSDAGDVQLTGVVGLVDADDLQNHMRPTSSISFRIGSKEFLTRVTGDFTIVVKPNDDRLVLIFPRGDAKLPTQTWVTYMTNIVTVPLVKSLAEYNVYVLLQIQPDPIILDSTQDQVILFGNTDGMEPLVSLTIPQNSMTLENGDLVSTSVLAYPTFNDPRVDSGLTLSPGDFTTIDSEGVPLNLQTLGVLGLTLVLESDSSISVILPGNVQLTLNPSHNDGDMSVWRMNQQEGNWDGAVPVDSVGGGRRRRKRQADSSSTNTSFPLGEANFLNYDKIDTRNRCWVRVYVYRDSAGTIPMKGATILVYSMLSVMGTNGLTLTLALTDVKGAACVLIPCNSTHEILLNTPYAYQASTAHSLPAGFQFVNTMSGTRVEFDSPAASDPDVTGGDGPVHTRPGASISLSCSNAATGPDYHFIFSISNFPSPGTLTPTEPSPGTPDSWYTQPADSVNRTACMVRVLVNTTEETVEVIATSFRGDANGFNYGHYETGMERFYTDRRHHYACMEVKCPDISQDDQDVFVQVNVKPSPSNTCTFNPRFTPNSNTSLDIVDFSNGRYSFLLHPCDIHDKCGGSRFFDNLDLCKMRPPPVKPDSCDTGIFIGDGPGRQARVDAFRQCVIPWSLHTGYFDCTV